MDEKAAISLITQTFIDIQTATSDGNAFFYYGPDGRVPERTMPFATLVTKDDYDTVSNLSREGVYRLNIGVSRETYESLLGKAPSAPGESGVVESGHDFTALDQVMPHPIYGHLHWICVLNPSGATLETAKMLLAEAYDTAVRRATKRNAADAG